MIGYSVRKLESENCIIQAVLCFSTVKSPFYIKLRPMNSVSQEICLMVWLRVWGPIIMRTETSCSEVSRRPLLTNQRLSCSSLTNQNQIFSGEWSHGDFKRGKLLSLGKKLRLFHELNVDGYKIPFFAIF